MAQIIAERLERLPTIRLEHGAHPEPNGELAACAMELASWLAGEPWSDHPSCACPVIGAFMRAWNDALPDAERNELLLPLIPRLVGTRGSDALAERRSLMAADWLVRTHTPAWLRLAGLTAQADMLAGLPEITSMAQVPSIRGPLEAVRKDADAAGAAAGAAWAAARAAWDAWDAAGDAAGDAGAAWAAARAAWDAWDAARAAARAAWDAWDAAWAALPTRKELQQSALALVIRMIEAQEPAAAA